MALHVTYQIQHSSFLIMVKFFLPLLFPSTFPYFHGFYHIYLLLTLAQLKKQGKEEVLYFFCLFYQPNAVDIGLVGTVPS